MEIDRNHSLTHLGVYLKGARDASASSSSPEQAQSLASGDDTVKLSASALELARARRLLEELPDLQSDKVERIRRQIAEGTYAVDAKAVAERMMGESFENDLLLKGASFYGADGERGAHAHR